MISAPVRFATASCLLSLSLCHTSSLSSNAIHSPRARSMPWFLVFATPMFCGFRSSRMRVSSLAKPSAIAAVPSVEQSSRISSSQFVQVCESTEEIASPIYFSALYAGMMTETSGCICSLSSLSFIQIFSPVAFCIARRRFPTKYPAAALRRAAEPAHRRRNNPHG